jgi:hypothetical protein
LQRWEANIFGFTQEWLENEPRTSIPPGQLSNPHLTELISIQLTILGKLDADEDILTKEDKVTSNCRKLHKDDLHN